jgi:RNA polymerase sigma-70 factor (ECF subfamily)
MEGIFEALAVRIQAREAAAEEEFVAMFQRRIRGFAMANAGDSALADELSQDVLWAVIRSLRDGKVQQPAQLPAFVWGTARNLLNDRLRTRSREKLTPLTDDMEMSRPAVEQEEFERQRAAHQAIGTLEPHERGVLLLSLVDGLQADDIAAKIGITPDAVRQRKSRALRKLAELLGTRSQSTAPRLH